MRSSVKEIKIGAVYRYGARRRLSKEEISTLLSLRAKMAENDAMALVSHWFTTEPYRR